MPHPDTEDFWAWSLDVYGRVGVADAALALQDAHGANVNVVLVCCWSAAIGAPAFDTGTFEAIERTLHPFSDGVTRPLRAVRRGLKHPAPPVTAEMAADLRKQVLEAELGAERIEQTLLEAAITEHQGQDNANRPGPARDPAPNPALAKAQARANLVLYARKLEHESGKPHDLALIDALINAVFAL